MTEPMTTPPEIEQMARRVVAENIDRWGWGPLDEIDGLSEHKLAIDAATAGIEAAYAIVKPRIEEAFKAGWDECDSLHQPGKHPFCATVEEAWEKFCTALRKDR